MAFGPAALPVTALVAVLLATAMPAASLSAEEVPAAAQAAPPVGEKRGELARLQDEIKLSDEVVQRLETQIRALDADRAKLAQELIDTAAKSRETEGKALEAEMRLTALGGEEDRIKASLKARRAVLVEVIASLQRMGQHPPPALLVRPEDALEAVRTAMLLGAVLPEMRHETEALAADLTRLASVRKAMTAERDGLRAELLTLAEERKRIDLLVEERQRVLAGQERNLASEQARAGDLAKEADGLKDLIARMEREIEPAKTAADAARQAPQGGKASLAALEDPSRLTPALPFDQARGLLNLPVTGSVVSRFGEEDGNGGTGKGILVATEPSATVTAPCDGWVVYAGPFRSYGQLLIINAGGGYHVVMAGMERIRVGLGQFVLTGEPVAAMGTGETRVASIAPSGAAAPTLYVEFRKNGISIDPTPWWTTKGEKARG